jgi:branched-chain amino acid transport system permease protein
MSWGAGGPLAGSFPATAILLSAGVLATLPWLGMPAFYESFLYLVCHWMVLALSWNILSGYSGYFSFGHGAFFGVGVYTSAWLAANLEWPFLATLPVAAATAALLGVALGAVVFRVKAVRGELFALLTLAVTFVVATIILNTPIDGGPGIYLHSVPVPALGPTASGSLYLLSLAAATAALLVAWQVGRSRLGTGLFAIHDDEDVAEVMGVPTYRYKLTAFAISCGLAGVAGGIQALFVTYVTVSETFNITVPLTVVLMSVLGGTRHWAGPAVGAVAITCLLFYFTTGLDPVLGKAAVGLILVAVILFLPQGLLGSLARRTSGDTAAAGPDPTPVAPAVLAAASEGSPARTARAPPRAVLQAAPLLEVRALSRAFKGVRALDSLDLKVYPGEILGLLGPNGSGKSTFINVVSGHFPPDSGAVLFEGSSIARVPAHRIARVGIARTYQIPRPFAHMTVLQNVATVAMFGGAALPRREALDEARRWLEFTGLQAKADALPDALNLHQRKFLELARALASRPRLLLLDEVLSGLTPAEINDAIALIGRIRDRGATIVFVEHVMRAVIALADRVAVLNYGRLIAQGPCEAVMRDDEVVRAYLGTASA